MKELSGHKYARFQLVMNFKDFFKGIFFLISVPSCTCCKTRLLFKENVLCNSCREAYEAQKFRYCSRCKKKLDCCDCSTFFLEKHYVKRVVKLFRYIKDDDNHAGNSIIYSLKRDNRRDVLNFAAEEIVGGLERCGILTNISNTVITNVPRRNNAIRKYGFDHTKVLAKRVAKIIGVEYAQLMVSHNKGEQKRSKNKVDRFNNLDFAYKRRVFDVKGKTVILIDDVVTTGASMSAAAKLIHELGAKKINGACLGIAYKDSYIPFVEDTYKL